MIGSTSVFVLSLNPLDWSSRIYFLLIAVTLLARWLIPWSANRWNRLVRETLLIAPAALFYFAVRGLVDARAEDAFRNAERVIAFERRVGIYWERELQHWIHGWDVLVTLSNWIYIWAHWPFLAATLIWLVLCHKPVYPTYRNALLISGAAGMVVFATFPVAPPRLMPDAGFIDTVLIHSQSYRILQPPSLANPYAAVPSLHFGWNLLMAIAIVRQARTRPGRMVGYIVPPAMYASIVLTANHYFVDGIIGGLIVLSALSLSVGLGSVSSRVEGVWRNRWACGQAWWDAALERRSTMAQGMAIVRLHQSSGQQARIDQVVPHRDDALFRQCPEETPDAAEYEPVHADSEC